MRGFRGIAVIFAGIIILSGTARQKQAEAAIKRNIKTSDELFAALKEPDEMVLCLQDDIELEKCMNAYGKKVIQGNGRYCIRRRVDKGKKYVGTLLCAKGKLLSLKGVTLEGCGKMRETPDQIRGRLLEVKSGTAVLDRGTVLRGNYNLTWRGDGGGGVRICAKGRVIMKKESRICDNLTMRDGAGVRVERGGVLVMKGGTICDNAVVGQSVENGYNGKGGGIYSEGTLIFFEGSTFGNLARAYQRDGIRYGGKGNEIYSAGKFYLGGSANVTSIYLGNRSRIDLCNAWKQERTCRVTCEDGLEGTVVVRAAKGCQSEWEKNFVWGGNSAFTLEKNTTCLHIRSKTDGKKSADEKIPSKKKERVTSDILDRQASPTPDVCIKKHSQIQEAGKQDTEPEIKPTIKPTIKPEIKPAKEPAKEPEPAVSTETPEVETKEVLQCEGRVQFVRDAGNYGVSEGSVWHLPEYAQLLQQTFRKDRSMYEQVWEIQADEMNEMRKQIRKNQNKTLRERCDEFLKHFGREKVYG